MKTQLQGKRVDWLLWLLWNEACHFQDHVCMPKQFHVRSNQLFLDSMSMLQYTLLDCAMQA